MDMRPGHEKDCTYVLIEWRESISAGFQKSDVSLAEGLEARVIPLLVAGDPEEDFWHEKTAQKLEKEQYHLNPSGV